MRLFLRMTVAAVATGAFATAAATTALQAQAPGAAAHSLVQDAWALQFAIGENLSLGSFAGGVISAKHHRSPARAWRYGLSLSAGHAAAREDAPDRTDATVGLIAHFLHYPTLARDPGGNVHMFWGVGPLARFQAQRVTPPVGESFTMHVLSVGAGGTIGGEWFVRQRISLSAEYQSSLRFSFFSESAPDSWNVRLGEDGVRFGVSVYFP
jgi:hypothetical protein